MFALQIHTVDFPQRLPITIPYTPVPGRSNPKNGRFRDENAALCPTELRGIPHLFRQLPSTAAGTAAFFFSTSIANPSLRARLLFIVAVPNYMSPEDFIAFCGSEVNHFEGMMFLRNDGVEDRYSVLISLESQLASDGFYCSFNGKRFRPAEAEVCHIYFMQSVENHDVAEKASTPPRGFTELPTCPICLERLDQDTSGIQVTLCDHSFQCSCISKWTYMSCQVCRLCQQQDEKPTCAVCGTYKNLWICLICGFVGCGRSSEKHAISHWSDTKHHYSLELETQQIWDYVGDKYVHRLNQSKADRKSAVMNPELVSTDAGCGTCDFEEETGLDGALFSSKVESIADEYNNLLASQLDIQRQHYEALLAEAKTSKESTISKAVEKATFSRMTDLQCKFNSYEEEKRAVAQRNEEFTKKQEELQKDFRDTVTRYTSLLKSKDEQTSDLEEQVRDLQIYVEARKTIAKMDDLEGIKDGTVLPVESSSTPSSRSSKRRPKSGRRNS